MIGAAVLHLSDVLDASLHAAMPAARGTERLVVLPDGRHSGAGLFVAEAVTLLVVGLDEEHANQQPPRRSAGPGAPPSARAVGLDLLLVARFTDYSRSWTALDVLLHWFATNPVHVPPHGRLPDVARMTFTPHQRDASERSALWSMLGAPYLPSLSCHAALLPPEPA